MRLPRRLGQQPRVAREVSDGGVDLGNRRFHEANP
jgi:hypothetical protein